jgi:hypothetical protein
MKTGIIDRFEGKFAVVEINGRSENIKRGAIPEGAHEGDVIVFADHKWAVDPVATELRRQIVQTLVDDLWE